MKNNKKLKASVLIVSMLILAVILIAALNLSLIAIREEKASVGASQSNQAFQAASTGVEVVMEDIIHGGHTLAKDLNNCKSSSGLIESGAYTVQLKDIMGVSFKCHVGSIDIHSIAKIKSVGTAMGQSRAIEASVSFP